MFPFATPPKHGVFKANNSGSFQAKAINRKAQEANNPNSARSACFTVDFIVDFLPYIIYRKN